VKVPQDQVEDPMAHAIIQVARALREMNRVQAAEALLKASTSRDDFSLAMGALREIARDD
jgi:hypothetical protein